ncbi:unnamed protein product [Gordionus sp. m RMFG-2023]|uniref:transmembrane protein 222-like n=1 Tax=Gordionus sp. m RMFG-2023 TaxID=3053472 RepID=UPI0030DE1662
MISPRSTFTPISNIPSSSEENTHYHSDEVGKRPKNSLHASLNGNLAPSSSSFSFPPTSLVWTPIPFITWFLPFVGHMGITSTRGIIYDFASPYHVSVNDMAFGSPTKYYPITPDSIMLSYLPKGAFEKISSQLEKQDLNYIAAKLWDQSLLESSREYNNYHVHNLFYDNCHSHVALCLNTFAKKIRQGALTSPTISDKDSSINTCNIANNEDISGIRPYWSVSKLATLMFFKGKFISKRAFFATWMPFIIIFTLICSLIIVYNYFTL